MPTTPTTEHDPKADPLSTEPGPFGDGVPPPNAEDDFTQEERLAAHLASFDRGYPIQPGDPLVRSYTVQAKQAIAFLNGDEPVEVDPVLPGGVPASSDSELSFNPHEGPGARHVIPRDGEDSGEDRVKAARKAAADADKARSKSGRTKK